MARLPSFRKTTQEIVDGTLLAKSARPVRISIRGFERLKALRDADGGTSMSKLEGRFKLESSDKLEKSMEEKLQKIKAGVILSQWRKISSVNKVNSAGVKKRAVNKTKKIANFVAIDPIQPLRSEIKNLVLMEEKSTTTTGS